MYTNGAHKIVAKDVPIPGKNVNLHFAINHKLPYFRKKLKAQGDLAGLSSLLDEMLHEKKTGSRVDLQLPDCIQ